ncbi:uncharacterized protein EDB91DRAFT_1124550 [Suillus paluster]|uniref:uncharacterized protein n=1 Tax=Suillus paluster TaxID=48578 RepID=UPI001B881779|nr:uncharacterized protein EDB91DRAFT_1124550 [Suillus paluster]KAG1744122.1 hypothetical protein EDB91DRAFT_1124550 [Suillus paluster]
MNSNYKVRVRCVPPPSNFVGMTNAEAGVRSQYNDIRGLVDSVNDGSTNAFMWEWLWRWDLAGEAIPPWICILQNASS